MKTFAQIGYEAYSTSCGGMTYGGRDMPTWDALSPHIRDAWGAAASAIAGAINAQVADEEATLCTDPPLAPSETKVAATPWVSLWVSDMPLVAGSPPGLIRMEARDDFAGDVWWSWMLSAADARGLGYELTRYAAIADARAKAPKGGGP